MQIAVDSDDVGNPKRIRLHGRSIQIIENIDRWPGSGYCYFKARSDDGNLYVLRQDEARDQWELIMFQSPLADARAPGQTANQQE
jgi:hypothetical protein